MRVQMPRGATTSGPLPTKSSAQAMWWEPACTIGAARADRDPAEALDLLYYRIRVDRVTGHRATPDSQTIKVPEGPDRKEGWLSRALRLVERRRPSV